ncbi:MAG: hypothetical protein AB8B60_15315 [Sulfitobacter sp.]
MTNNTDGAVLIYSIHRTEHWFAHLGRNMGFAQSAVVSCLPGEGDYNVIADFQKHQKAYYAQGAMHSELLTAEEVKDMTARCRVLRFMGARRAASMALGMAEAFSLVLDAVNPVAIVSFPIDRYVSDVLEHVARKRGIPFYELTVSALPDQSMLLKKGALLKHPEDPDPELVTRGVEEMATPLYTPSYVQGKDTFTQWKFFKVLAYFRLRGFVFRLFSIWYRDRLNLHYLDAQSWLGHKPRISDRKVTGLMDRDWQSKLDTFPEDKRLFIALQLFPEASIDYWVRDLGIVDYENTLVEIAQTFSAAGYAVVVKDHPQQFGFRQIGLLKRLLAIEGVILVPYEVPGTSVLAQCNINFTTTGTLGLQAALLGLKSIVTENYYSTEEDFIVLHDRAGVSDLPARVEAMEPPADLEAGQRRIITNLQCGSFESDFFSFQGFDPNAPSAGATELGRLIGIEVRRFLAYEAREN